MNKRNIIFICTILIVVVAVASLAACGTKTPAATASGGSTADGQTLMQTRCTVCHSTARIISAHQTADQWKATVDLMIGKGAQLSPTEEQTLVTYLAQNYK